MSKISENYKNNLKKSFVDKYNECLKNGCKYMYMHITDEEDYRILEEYAKTYDKNIKCKHIPKNNNSSFHCFDMDDIYDSIEFS